ncbi:uncharacterized protein LOC131675459 [Phymastichus coffea]|uniref:uncharacterized protein LOC131675459 n=1 Tax=Phymastichus coffea TaxID=108790 RepID=UPI00273B7553|nr:uncharacterized protein LOC131675459 [Phymastichus coffea]
MGMRFIMSSTTNTKQRYKNCIRCNLNERKSTGYKRFIQSQSVVDDLKKCLNVDAEIDDFICSKCYAVFSCTRSRLTKEEATTTNQSEDRVSQSFSQLSVSSTNSSQQTDPGDPPILFTERKIIEEDEIELPIPRCIATHKYCCICRKDCNLMAVPMEARLQVFTMRNIFIPAGNRCCKDHFIKKRLYEEVMNNIIATSNVSSMKASDVSNFLQKFRIDVDKELTDKVGDFSLPENRLIIFTGLTWENLFELRAMMTSLRNSDSRNVTQAIVVFLFKLRTGNSNNVISSVLGLERPEQVSDFSASVLESFEKDVLPSRFGIKAANRQYLIENHTAPVAKLLHDLNDSQLKSTNNEYQRKSYSGQKKAPLCKPFTICTTNGYIVDMLGPYYANVNDAKILEDIFNDPEGLVTLLRPGDKFFLDRGFRDVICKLTVMGYEGLMPALKGQRKQLTATEGNNSRMVTIVRWVVEAVHGVNSQKYKLLHNQFDNKMIPHAGTYCRIACFLINLFGKRFVSSISSSEEVVNLMKRKKDTGNSLAEEAESGRWSRRKTKFMKLTSNDILDFPEMTEEDLKIFFTGTYQLSQAISYLAELIDEEGRVNIDYLKESSSVLKIQVRSRHISAKTYNCYIEYTPNSIGYGGVKRYYCECANGMRTVGCCSHIASVIYFLSHARYLSKIIRPTEKLTKIYQEKEIVPVINDDSDED